MKPKTNPIPTRLDDAADADLTALAEKTGIPKAELIRRCLRFALPQFISGEADLLNYGRPAAAEVETGKEAA